ncbi:MAG: divalent-cation tolerance protein CutA [Candidatus Thorarchaeota archaeon]|nr:divalent-cation tolerance protein CutA [Candidatus Thorarchaeota archaeon]
MEEYVIAITTCTESEADRLANALIQSRTCACVNAIRGVTSTYYWRGALQCEKECILVMKTRRELTDRLYRTLKDNHSYEIPEFIVIGIQQGSPEYLAWLSESTLHH